jgi:hypothetical protein
MRLIGWQCLGIVLSTVMTIASEAHGADVDWKVYEAASVAGPEFCFYDANGVVRTPDGNVRAWTKCLPQKDMDAIDIEHDFGGKLLEDAARKIKEGCVPPSVAAGTLEFDQVPGIVAYEEIANLGSIQPHTNIFYELNCAQKMLRELSIHISVNGKSGSIDKPTPWEFVPPEGNGAMLLKLLCRLP